MNTVKFFSILVVTAMPVLAMASGNHDTMGGMPMQHSELKVMDDDHGHDQYGDEHNNMAGGPGDPAKVNRNIVIDMSDNMRFTPGEVKIKAGETIRFKIKNNGKLNHELVIGSMAELKEHAEMMRKMPTMRHSEANMITLEPGKSGELVWKFDKAGTVDFACLIPGHMEAGMKGQIQVQ